MEPLTTAQLRALHALARYETATEAARNAGLSPQTLRNQANSAYRKLGVNGKVDAWRKLGWLRPPRFMPSAEDPEPFVDQFVGTAPDEEEFEEEAEVSALVPDAHPSVTIISEKMAHQLQAPMIARFKKEQEAKRRSQP